MHNYSTSEQIVGTDVDGSTVYEKTWYADNVSWSSTQTIDSSFVPSNLKRVVSINGAIKPNASDWTSVSYDAFGSGATYQGRFSIKKSTGLTLAISNLTISAYHVTIRYVKN